MGILFERKMSIVQILGIESCSESEFFERIVFGMKPYLTFYCLFAVLRFS